MATQSQLNISYHKCSSVKELSVKFQPKRLALIMIVIVMTMLNDNFYIQENEFEPRQLMCSSLNFLSLQVLLFPPAMGTFFS